MPPKLHGTLLTSPLGTKKQSELLVFFLFFYSFLFLSLYSFFFLGYLLGEFGHLISEKMGSSPMEQLEVWEKGMEKEGERR